jgi:hypothetical protein
MADPDDESGRGAVSQRLSDFEKRAPVLRTFTVLTGIVHLVSAIATLVLNVDKMVPASESYMSWPSSAARANPETNVFTFGKTDAGKISFKGLVAAFFFLSAIFQIVSAVFTPVWEWLLSLLLHRNVQPLRWFEYSISASVMFLIAFLLNGASDVHKLVLVFSLSFLMMALGLVAECYTYFQRELEYVSNGKNKRHPVDYFLVHVVGWVPFVTLWGITFRSFLLNAQGGDSLSAGKQRPPFWVYILYSTQIVIMGLFGLNQLWQQVDLFYVRAGDFARQARIARRTEYLYVLLSLSAKSVLAWVLYFGMRAQGSTSY